MTTRLFDSPRPWRTAAFSSQLPADPGRHVAMAFCIGMYISSLMFPSQRLRDWNLFGHCTKNALSPTRDADEQRDGGSALKTPWEEEASHQFRELLAP